MWASHHSVGDLIMKGTYVSNNYKIMAQLISIRWNRSVLTQQSPLAWENTGPIYISIYICTYVGFYNYVYTDQNMNRLY